MAEEVKKDFKKDKVKMVESLLNKRSKTIDGTFIESGTVGLDLALSGGKGLPLGDWITVVADPGCGKTTLFADALRRLAKRHKAVGVPFKALYIDVENSKGLLVSMGLGEYLIDGTITHIPGRTTFEELDALYDAVFSDTNELLKDVKLIIIDSITGVISDWSTENGVEKAEFGNDAKALTKLLKKYVPLHEEKKITTVAICQVRQRQGATAYEEKTKGAVISSLYHSSTILMKMKKSTSKQNKEMKTIKVQTVEGIVDMQEKFIITLSTLGNEKKNRYGAIPDVTVLMHYGQRAINQYTVKNLLLGWGYVKASSAAYYNVSKDLPIEGIKDTTYTKTELNYLITQNLGAIVEFLKVNNQYTPTMGNVKEEDDGYNIKEQGE